MSQATYLTDPTRTKAQARSFVDAVLQAIVTCNSGATEPAETYPYREWMDTATGLLKRRNGANTGWVTLGHFDQAAGTFTPAVLHDLSIQAGDLLYGGADGTLVRLGMGAQGQVLTQGGTHPEWAENADAPIEGWHPYDMLEVGDGADGLIYDRSVDGKLAVVTTPNFEDGYEYALFFSSVSHDSAVDRPLQWRGRRFSSATDTDYASVTDALGSADLATGQLVIAMPRVAASSIGASWMDGNWSPGRVFVGVGDKLRYAQVRFENADFDAGKIYMWRRREYVSG